MVSSTAAANSLTVAGTASGSYSLRLMTIVLLIFGPAVVVYQSWTYHVFRQRVRVATPSPAAGADRIE
jgi:cytochrome d ubiquinol oxidase subunit II